MARPSKPCGARTQRKRRRRRVRGRGFRRRCCPAVGAREGVRCFRGRGQAPQLPCCSGGGTWREMVLTTMSLRSSLAAERAGIDLWQR
jgi:hypothetical protein